MDGESLPSKTESISVADPITNPDRKLMLTSVSFTSKTIGLAEFTTQAGIKNFSCGTGSITITVFWLALTSTLTGLTVLGGTVSF